MISEQKLLSIFANPKAKSKVTDVDQKLRIVLDSVNNELGTH